VRGEETISLPVTAMKPPTLPVPGETGSGSGYLRKMRILIVACILILLIGSVSAGVTEDDSFAIVYFHGTGCSHCQNVDGYIFFSWLETYPSLVVIDYEIIENQENNMVFLMYDEVYHSGKNIPLLFFSPTTTLAEDYAILQQGPDILEKCMVNRSFREETTIAFGTLDLVNLPGYPRFWHGDRVLFKTGAVGTNALLRNLLFEENLSEALDGVDYSVSEPIPLYYSRNAPGEFQHAIRGEGWTLQWNDPGFEYTNPDGAGNEPVVQGISMALAPIISVLIAVYFGRTWRK
jgi:hypothetical protein